MTTFDGWYMKTLKDSEVDEAIADPPTVARLVALLQMADRPEAHAEAA